MLRVLAVLSILLPHVVQAREHITVPRTQAEISLGFAPVVQHAAPAVVNIYAKRVVQEQSSPFAGDPFFQDLFRDFGSTRPRVQNSLGSGVILGADGIIVSNYHVVGQATDIRVVLSDRREFHAQVLLGDRDADLAVLKLDGVDGLPTLALRDSDRVQVGELALAIGNPFGVGQTVSSGIVSGLARSGVATGSSRGYFIQTDAPINPGNSGGALVDINGDLIGINTAIVSRSGGSNGIGFAIPANLISQFLMQARAGATRFERPWAGLSGQPVDFDLAASLGIDIPEGMLISDMHAQSPFAQAGFEPGDVVTAVDGLPVNSPPEMLFRMTVRGIGSTAMVTRLRDGKESIREVSMIAAPDVPPADLTELDDRTVLPGLVVARVNPRVITDYNLSFRQEGVVITNPGPIAARVGLQPGDVVNAINGKEISSPADVRRALRNPGRRVRMDLLRGGQRIVLQFRT